MGMAVKTDGADAAAGELLDVFMRNKKTVETDGAVVWPEGIITASAVMTKVWIDMFIGLWAFVLALVWVYKVEPRKGEKVPVSEVWFRFPKFVLGYFATWFILLGIFFAAGAGAPEGMDTPECRQSRGGSCREGIQDIAFHAHLPEPWHHYRF